MYSTWALFFANLKRDPPVEEFGAPATAYTHSSGLVYARRAGAIGEGRYGRVYAYAAKEPRPPLPSSFCVKCIQHDAKVEVYAVTALAALTATDRSVRGFVPAAVLRTNGEGADVGMPLYSHSMPAARVHPGAAAAVVAGVTSVVATLWAAGLAYTDIKTSNILVCESRVVLCDLGSIVPRRTRDGRRPAGIFTFPPRRAVKLRDATSSDDGVVPPHENDLVWSLGTLLMTLTHGGAFVASRFTGNALRELSGRAPPHMHYAARMAYTFDTLDVEMRNEFEPIRAANGAAGARCADAIGIAFDAWAGNPAATLEAFGGAIRGRTARRRQSSPQ